MIDECKFAHCGFIEICQEYYNRFVFNVKKSLNINFICVIMRNVPSLMRSRSLTMIKWFKMQKDRADEFSFE